MDFPPVPIESRGRIKAAGELLALGESSIGEAEQARVLLSKWRACHLFPLHMLANDLNRRLARLELDAIVALRLKRLFRIVDKLKQFPGMNVTRMQDIAALRAILPKPSDVALLVTDYHRNPPENFGDLTVTDYIASPKENGYRSVHLMPRYRGLSPSGYDGLRAELQVRTKLQHLWASAVEVAGMRHGSPIKYDEGDPEWRDFFAMCAEIIARKEGFSSSDSFGELDDNALCDRLETSEGVIHALEEMRASGTLIASAGLETIPEADGIETTLVLRLMPSNRLDVAAYGPHQYEQAMHDYAKAEDSATFAEDGRSVVLVSVSEPKRLRDAYQTFFLDASEFAKVIDGLVKDRKGP